MKILLIRLRLIGDVVFTTPAIRALRRQFPDARLVYVVEPDAAPIVRANPHLDQVIVACRPDAPGRLRQDLALIRGLRRERFNLAVDFHGGPRASLMAWASGAPRRIGYEIAGRGWMYTERVARPRELRPRHSVLNQWDLLAPLQLPPLDPTRDATEMPVEPEAAQAVLSRLHHAGVRPEHTLVVVHVSAGNPFRRWPADAFVALLVRLVNMDRAARILVTSGPSDAEAAGRILARARQHLEPAAATALLDCGEFDLVQLRAVLDHAALYVGGDSGPLHIAGTTRVPVVALFGPTLAERSVPWRDPSLVTEPVEPGPLSCRPCDQRRCEPGDFRCLSSITPDQVATACERALARSRHESLRGPLEAS
jgi:ADP-heptose:LPS heptosyltransferase